MDVINVLATRYGASSDADTFERESGLMKQKEILPRLPEDSRISIKHEEARLGLISHGDYKQALIYRIREIHRERGFH